MMVEMKTREFSAKTHRRLCLLSSCAVDNLFTCVYIYGIDTHNTSCVEGSDGILML